MVDKPRKAVAKKIPKEPSTLRDILKLLAQSHRDTFTNSQMNQLLSYLYRIIAIQESMTARIFDADATVAAAPSLFLRQLTRIGDQLTRIADACEVSANPKTHKPIDLAEAPDK